MQDTSHRLQGRLEICSRFGTPRNMASHLRTTLRRSEKGTTRWTPAGVQAEGYRADPSTPSDMPEAIHFSQSDRLLHVGSGAIGPVSPEVWSYHVSSMHVLQKWFDYRKREPRTRYSSPLNNIVADRWTAETTEALRDLVAVLQGCIALEAQQRRLLEVICEGSLLDQLSLEELGVLPAPSTSNRPIIDDGSTLF